MTIALTGHRPNKLGMEYEHDGPVSQSLMRQMEACITNYGATKIITGMALGADTLWALTAIRMGIPFIAAIPFKGQERMWPMHSQQRYKDILAKAESVVVVCEGEYAAWKMQKRNEWMVDNCDVLIAVWDGTRGGTSNCITYAKSKNKTMVALSIPVFGNARHLAR